MTSMLNIFPSPGGRGKGRGVFVTGTDTGAGKTTVTACLAKFLKQKGWRVMAQKWAATGVDNPRLSADTQRHLGALGLSKEEVETCLPHMAPYVFRKPCSPYLAGRLEGKRAHAGKIIKSFQWLSQRFDIVLVEGTGGVLVPFNKKHFLTDIAAELGLPVLLVAANRVGAINHTLLSIEGLRRRGLKILGLVFNNLPGQDKEVLEDNPRLIKALTKEKIFGVLPYALNEAGLERHFNPIARRIFKSLKNGPLA